MVLFDAIARDSGVRALIAAADTKLDALGFNEYGLRHAERVADVGSTVLRDLGFHYHPQELVKIAGLLHDIGNAVSRNNHAATGALLTHDLLSRMAIAPDDIAVISGHQRSDRFSRRRLRTSRSRHGSSLSGAHPR